MIQNVHINAHERGLLFRRGDFVRVLTPGRHTLFGGGWSVAKHDLNAPEVDLPNLDLLLATRADALRRDFVIVRTGPNEAALVRVGRLWQTVGRDQVRAFWKGFVEVEALVFDLSRGLELPAEVAARLPADLNLPGLREVNVTESQIGLLYVDGNFARPLEPGRTFFWHFGHRLNVQLLDRTKPDPGLPNEDVLVERHPEFTARFLEPVALGPTEVALVRWKGRVVAVLPPTTRKLYWKGVAVEVIDVAARPALSAPLVAELVNGLPDVATLASRLVVAREVPEGHTGLLYEDGVLSGTLGPGSYAWWVYGRTLRVDVVDRRARTLEVSGQEILTRDKVPLRLNLTAGVRVTDPVAARAAVVDLDAHLYKELQFALRAAVGTRSLDELLEDKGLVDRHVAEYMAARTTTLGAVIEAVGVKDVILPGEIKAILSKVVEAEKAAQANVIRRREETAATRSMLNTAKVMEDNPVALRLKELEVLERVAEKVERIQVGSTDGLLTELVKIRRD